jgi:hypothetical protein
LMKNQDIVNKYQPASIPRINLLDREILFEKK